ncbi:MAG: MBL fold metallo-hydrolase [Acetivibrio ethanolgignens]
MNLKKTLYLIIFAFCCLLTGCFSEIAAEPAAKGSLRVHFISVGQGNAVLAESDGHYMLVDGGDGSHSSKVISYLKEQGVKKLDYVISTHYDADHLSGILGAIKVFPTDLLLGPDYTTDTKLFSSYLKTQKELGLTSVHPASGDTYSLGSCNFTILAPNSTGYSDENDYSIALRLVCGSTSFLLTGDAGINSEEEMLRTGLTLNSDVYLTGHHGSSTSNSEDFLEAVSPSYAVISVGRGNPYGHPHREVLASLSARGISIFRTDTQGSILIESNGKDLTFNTQPDTQFEEHTSSSQDTCLPFIGNKNTKKFHRSDCSGLPKEHNRIYFKAAVEALNEGYEPCANCRPN